MNDHNSNTTAWYVLPHEECAFIPVVPIEPGSDHTVMLGQQRDHLAETRLPGRRKSMDEHHRSFVLKAELMEFHLKMLLSMFQDYAD